MSFAQLARISFFKKCLWNRWFLVILAVKVVFSFLFASGVMVKGFIPFINYFVESGFRNPYDYFYSQGILKAFPYSTVMLWVLAVPRAFFSFLLSGAWEMVSVFHLFVARIPVILADIAIYLVLCKWLPARENKVRLFYWACPALFYINYYHGQLDAIPTAFLFVSLAMLFLRMEWFAFLLLGVGIATKTHLLIALPFYLLYVYVKKTPKLNIAKYLLSALAVFGVLLLPYVFSHGYQELVLKAEEQGWIFNLGVPYRNVSLLIVPAVYLILFLRFAAYKKMTQDFFIMILALIFTVLVLFVPPMPGWFYWSVPFLAYFYSNTKEAPAINFWFFNLFFLAYFLFSDKSDLFASFQTISPAIAALKTPYDVLRSFGADPQLIMNLLFTVLEAVVFMNVFYCYKIGIRDNFVYKLKTKPLLIGIGGDSGSGKTTLAKMLAELFNEKNVVCVRGDDAHKWPRGHQQWQVFTHLDPKGNKLHRDFQHAIALKAGCPVERVTYDHVTGKFTDPVKVEPNKVIIFEGLHPYYIKQARSLFDVKIFVEAEESLRIQWKIRRDVEERGHKPGKVAEELRRRGADAGKYIEPQKDLADIVVSYKFFGETNELAARLTVNNSIDVESFVQNLQGSAFYASPPQAGEREQGEQSPTSRQGCEPKRALKIEYFYEQTDKITIECSGHVESGELAKIAYDIIPNFYELTQASPVFEPGIAGVIQLFVIYCLSETSKLEERIGNNYEFCK